MTNIEIALVVVVALLVVFELLGIAVGRANYRRLKEAGEKDLEELRKRIERIEQDRRRG